MSNVTPSSRISIAFRDYVLEGPTVLSGTGWSGGTLPNLATNNFTEAALATTNSTDITLDLGSSVTVDVVSIPTHTLGTSSTGRLRVSNNVLLLTDANSVPVEDILYDTGTVSIWPSITDILDIPYSEYESWGSTFTGYKFPPLYTTDICVTARYIHIELNDPDSSSYTLSKITTGPNWRPTGGLSAGWTDKYVQGRKAHTRLPGGGVFVEDRASTRQLNFSLKTLTEAEIFNQVAIIDKQLTKKIPYLVILDPTDNKNSSRLFIYGANSKITAVKNIFTGFFSKTFILDEWT